MTVLSRLLLLATLLNHGPPRLAVVGKVIRWWASTEGLWAVSLPERFCTTSAATLVGLAAFTSLFEAPLQGAGAVWCYAGLQQPGC